MTNVTLMFVLLDIAAVVGNWLYIDGGQWSYRREKSIEYDYGEWFITRPISGNRTDRG